ncbi:MAG: hypothetical protein KDD73_10995 [Anaerolineales bacterium]|nr:hypothetical protein [Anaerolineales bacterium]MCB9127010.1 hypothetical protein [Ardenticatenales bacterium]MCB9172362.1 hypothetical protein [Ardenticatenales bacterium]
MEFRYQQNNQVYPVRVIERGEYEEVVIDGRHYRVRAKRVDESTLDLWIDGDFTRVRHASDGNRRWVALEGATHQATLERHRRATRNAGDAENTLAAEMPGQIVAVAVAEGDAVQRGALLVLMEAMKMELRVIAPHDGTIDKVLVATGEAVERGQTLIEMALQ